MPASPPRDRFRAEIAALRACAVLLVVLYHLWPGRLPGGYIGVDVFFVISGFLITGHLLRETADTGRIDLARFWARRARRLLPAAYLVLASSALAVWLWLPLVSWRQNFTEVIASALYVQNWALAADSVDYLAAEAEPTAVQHYWTLSIEEQFYLVWPLLVLLATVLAVRLGRSRRLTVAVVLGATTIASLAYSLWITQANPPAAYFVTPARAWQFGAGALLALAMGSATVRRGGAASALSWAGFGALAWCGLTYDASTPFPGTAAIVPVVATLAVIWAGEPTGPLSPTALMRWRVTHTLGEISYSMYLWHWPPIVILPYVLGHELGLGERIGILAFTIAASWATKRWVEDPVRFTGRLGLRRPARTGVATLAGAALLVSGCLVGHQSAVAAEQRASEVAAQLVEDAPDCFGAASRDPEKHCVNPELADQLVPSPEAVVDDYARQYPGCFAGVHDTKLNDCTFGDLSDDSLPHVTLLGDSHARSFLPALVRMADQRLITLSAQLKSSCSWTRDEIDHEDPLRVSSCQEFKQNLQAWLVDRAPETDLILTTGYARLLTGSGEEQVDSMAAVWRPIIDAGVRIVAIRDNPRLPSPPQKCLSQLEQITPDACAFDRDEALGHVDAFAAAGTQVDGAQVLDLTPFYCDDATCPAIIGGVNVYRDITHLSVTYVRTMTPYVYRRLVGMGALPRPT
ncbi:acyltransferase [Aeromicrobium flavum]|uniref:Acyltransferase n=1 Tax=Aeromicrobium flavum TaxID=416568 RepID=A0A512HTB2_9ACTN|nr:acyltransferase family protein [Aeromicrobium flavum]GEO88684.1 acyltransferase [Aeromicrobium flavum]